MHGTHTINKGFANLHKIVVVSPVYNKLATNQREIRVLAYGFFEDPTFCGNNCVGKDKGKRSA